MKENAKEYLKEFAGLQSDDWLKALIYEAIETNGNISDERQIEILDSLVNDTSLTITEPNINNDNLDNKITISSLKHISGVNALKENQTIKFHENVTILYGLNGAGKSSYFKVLNEIVGGNQKKEILSNIYSDTPKPIEVEISFKEKTGRIQTINWDNNSRSLDLLNKCKVFDISYLNGLLGTRSADTTLIQPLGLNLFSYLVKLIDELKSELNREADDKRLEKPEIELELLSEEVKNGFKNHRFDESLKKGIEKLFSFSEENSSNLKKTQEELLDLKQTNFQDKITLKTNDKDSLIELKTHIEQTNKKLSGFSITAQNSIESLIENKEANDLAKKQFNILSTIPGEDTPEWKEFIKSGENYKLKVDDSDKNCLYCRQPLQDENARKIIAAYGNFLKDESEQALNDSIEQINSLINELELLATETTIKDNIQAILEESNIENKGKTLYQVTTDSINIFSAKKAKLIEKIQNNDANAKIPTTDVSGIVNNIKKLIESIQVQIGTLSGENLKKDKQIEQKDKVLKQLLENESISKQQSVIEEWFEINISENKLRKKESKINTNKISNLSTKADNELLTGTLKQNFSVELEALGYPNLEVGIEKAGSSKGVSSTRLTLLKNNDIKSILSEGEQKAVALALFLAETKIQKSKNPIILDDPVNSLSHNIAGNFAQRLLKLGNQIILFSHNRLFLDAFETSRENHICKAIYCDNAKSEHIRVYQVKSEGKNSKGVLSLYTSNKAENHIAEAKKLLSKSPFKEELTVAALLRKAVECTIDEVIFNKQSPTKYSNKNSKIYWDKLKELNSNPDVIDKLNNIYKETSGAIHNGAESIGDPIEIDEFNKMVLDIETIINPPPNNLPNRKLKNHH